MADFEIVLGQSDHFKPSEVKGGELRVGNDVIPLNWSWDSSGQASMAIDGGANPSATGVSLTGVGLTSTHGGVPGTLTATMPNGVKFGSVTVEIISADSQVDTIGIVRG